MKEIFKIIFIGTPDFAVPSLKALLNDPEFNLTAVITQPDKKVGRKQILTPPPVKILGLEHNLKIFQPEKIKTIEPEIKELAPDIIIVAAYAQLIPKSILDIPRFGCVNVHGSLLPKYRGSSCIQAAILNGDSETGVTIMLMGEKLDNGPILFQDKIKILSNDTAGSLYEKLAELGAKILVPTLKNYLTGEITPQAQDDNLASYVKNLKKEDGKINWDKDAIYLERFVRAMQPWPRAWTNIIINGKSLTLKIIEAQVEKNDNNLKSGELFLVNGSLAVKCARGALLILKLQLEGKKEIASAEFLRGYKDIIGKILA